jgi:hypothetical protein
VTDGQRSPADRQGWPATGTPRAGGRARPARRARRALLRERDGSVVDLAARRVVDVDELLDDLKAGRRFRVHRRDTGADCTVEVLGSVLAAHVGGGDLLGLLAPRLSVPRRAAAPARDAGPVVPLHPVAWARTEADGGG